MCDGKELKKNIYHRPIHPTEHKNERKRKSNQIIFHIFFRSRVLRWVAPREDGGVWKRHETRLRYFSSGEIASHQLRKKISQFNHFCLMILLSSIFSIFNNFIMCSNLFFSFYHFLWFLCMFYWRVKNLNNYKIWLSHDGWNDFIHAYNFYISSSCRRHSHPNNIFFYLFFINFQFHNFLCDYNFFLWFFSSLFFVWF